MMSTYLERVLAVKESKSSWRRHRLQHHTGVSAGRAYMACGAGIGDSGPGSLEGWTGIRPAKEEPRRTLKQGKGQVQRSGWMGDTAQRVQQGQSSL